MCFAEGVGLLQLCHVQPLNAEECGLSTLDVVRLKDLDIGGPDTLTRLVCRGAV